MSLEMPTTAQSHDRSLANATVTTLNKGMSGDDFF